MVENNLSGSSNKEGSQQKFSEDQIKQKIHEINIYIQKFSKYEVGKGSDHIKTNICEDMIIFRGKGFLTEPEKYIAQTPTGSEMIMAARNNVILRWHDFEKELEEKFNAKVVYDSIDIKPDQDYWIRVVVFDRCLI